MVSPLFLCVQSSYSLLQVALFEGDECLQSRIIHDARSSSHLIMYFDTLLREHGKKLSDVAFIAIDAGPGAFTSLRVAIASVNGIGFGCNKPLIGVNGLEALLLDGVSQLANVNDEIVGVVGILNAYGHDAYFIAAATQNLKNNVQGCKKIYEVIADLEQKFPSGKMLMVGNGIKVFEQELDEALKDRLIVVDPLQEVPSVKYIATLGYQQWCMKKEFSARITPHYLKSQLFAVKPVR